MEIYEKMRSQVESKRNGLIPQQRPGVIEPFKVDFVADVELTAKRLLNDEDFKFFKSYHCDGCEPTLFVRGSEGFIAMDDRVHQILGKAFKHVGLYPVGLYFRPKSIVRKKR